MITTHPIDFLLKGIKNRSMTRITPIKYKPPKRVSITSVKPLRLKAIKIKKVKGITVRKPRRISIPSFKMPKF